MPVTGSRVRRTTSLQERNVVSIPAAGSTTITAQQRRLSLLIRPTNGDVQVNDETGTDVGFPLTQGQTMVLEDHTGQVVVHNTTVAAVSVAFIEQVIA